MNSLNNPLGIIIALYIFVFGCCIGSFLNVVILRGLEGENFIKGSSKCPKCHNVLKWYMNIPILSYLFLRGKCAFCKTKISIQYPIVELICGLGFLLSYFVFGLGLKMAFSFIFISFFILLSATDILETVIIDTHAYGLAIFGLIYSYFINFSWQNLLSSFLAGVLGFIIFELFSRLGLKLIKHRFFGEGDSLIILGLGTIFQLKGLLIIIPLSFLIQAAFSIPILALKALKERKKPLFASYIFVFLGMISIILINYYNLIQNEKIYLSFAVLITLILLWSLKNILSEIEEKKNLINDNLSNDEIEDNSPYCLMPFGPALILAASIVLFIYF